MTWGRSSRRYFVYGGQLTLHVREVHLAEEGVDYVEGKIGYRALSRNSFIAS